MDFWKSEGKLISIDCLSTELLMNDKHVRVSDFGKNDDKGTSVRTKI